VRGDTGRGRRGQPRSKSGGAIDSATYDLLEARTICGGGGCTPGLSAFPAIMAKTHVIRIARRDQCAGSTPLAVAAALARVSHR
jgi:hypothetical protein